MTDQNLHSERIAVLKQSHRAELFQVEAQILRLRERRDQLGAILATLEEVQPQPVHAADGRAQ